MLLKKPVAIALACLLSGCACTTPPSVLPVPVIAPETEARPPVALTTLPARPEPLAPGYSRTH